MRWKASQKASKVTRASDIAQTRRLARKRQGIDEDEYQHFKATRESPENVHARRETERQRAAVEHDWRRAEHLLKYLYRESLPAPRSKEEYERTVPPGSKFVAPDGTVRVRVNPGIEGHA